MSIESKVADTILQAKKEITLGGKTFTVAPPTPATLIRLSQLISQLPAVKSDSNKVLMEVLHHAKDCTILGDIAATIILGASKARKCEKKAWWKLWTKKTSQYRLLADFILYECEVSEVYNLISEQLLNLQIVDFFAITTSLFEVNLLRATKEVVTASGD